MFHFVLSLIAMYPQPNAESLKKVLDGKVALTVGKREESLPGGEPEGNFSISLSKMLRLDEASLFPLTYSRTM